MPKAGKKGKGKAKDGLALEVDALKAEENAKKKEEWNRIRLLQKLEEESKLSGVNAKILDNFWRDKMREAKTLELKKQIDVLAQQHDRQVDRKDALISMLLSDIEESEEQYRLALRSHIQNVDSLIALHQQRVSELHAEFERDLLDLEHEFGNESHLIAQRQVSEKAEIEDIIMAMKKEHESAEEELKQEFSTQKDDLKNRNTEEYTVLKITLEKIIEEYRHKMQEEHDAYTSATEGTLKEYHNLMTQDQETAKTIDSQLRKVQRLQESLSHWKAKLANAVRDGEKRNSTLRSEKETVTKHFKDLKFKMTHFRDSQKRRMTELVSNSRNTIQKLEKMVEQADRILRLTELNSKYESEREKVLPFYASALSPEEELLAREKFLAEVGGPLAAAGHSSGSRTGGSSSEGKGDAAFGEKNLAEELDALRPLDNFYKRYNKVMLDKVALDEERERLGAENAQLRAMLKDYLDGISVSEEVLARANPLVVVQRAPRKGRDERGSTNGRGLVEAALVANQISH